MDSYLHLALVQAIWRFDIEPSENTRVKIEELKGKIMSHASAKRIGNESILQSLLVKDLVMKWNRFRPHQSDKMVKGNDTQKASWEKDPKKYLKYISQLSDYLVESVEDLLVRFSELLTFFDLELTSKEEEHLRYTFQLITLFSDLIPQVKYSVNLAFNWTWDEVPPVFGSHYLGWYLFPRSLKLRIKQMKKYRDRKKNQIRMNTLFQGFKKGLMPVHPDQVDDSLIKHEKALTSETNELPEEISERFEELLTEMVQEYKCPKKFTWNQPISRKATYDYSFGKGGNVAYLAERLGYFSSPARTSHLIGYVNRSDSWEPIEVRSCSPTRRELLENDEGFRALKFIASPACILEPMKVRIITKPFQGLHLGLPQLQKSLWSFLFHHHSGFFRLIGEPLNRGHLLPILAEWDVGKSFNSGDFSAATDNLKQEATKMIYCKFFEELFVTNPRLYYRGLYSLTKSQLDYERSVIPNYPLDSRFDHKSLEVVDQVNGQLMGNVLSFPILCIANYISYHISYEKYIGHKVRLWKTPSVLINGDDILFCTKEQHYKIWCNITKSCGLEPSVGKNYFNDKFLQINSELWVPLTTEINGRYRAYDVYKVPYVNFGMLTHRRKQDCSTDLSRISQQQMVGGINKCITEKGGEISDGWLARLQNLVTIRKKLLGDLPIDLAKKAETVFDKHCKPIFGSLGLWKFYFDKFPDSYIDHIMRAIIAPVPSLAREIFPEYEMEKLNSELYLNWEVIKQVKKSLPYYFPFGNVNKAKITRPLENRITDNDLVGW